MLMLCLFFVNIKDNNKLSLVDEEKKLMKIEDFYKVICKQDKLDKNYAIIFVYNDPDLLQDAIHKLECITPLERNLIIKSFRHVANFVYEINSEDGFMNVAESMKSKHKHILVYNMSQNLHGAGRRSLVPLLCQYHKFINIGAEFLDAVLGRCKSIMYRLLEDNPHIVFPKTLHIGPRVALSSQLLDIFHHKIILKPDNESASIGVEIISLENIDACIERIAQYRKQYPLFCIQEFIEGQELEVTLMYDGINYYTPGVCELISSHEFLTYDVIALENYSFGFYTGRQQEDLIRMAIEVAKELNFQNICRVDFRLKENQPYIIDIGVNPTLSEFSSSNFMFRHILQQDATSIYKFLVYNALLKNQLFKPVLDYSK